MPQLIHRDDGLLLESHSRYSIARKIHPPRIEQKNSKDSWSRSTRPRTRRVRCELTNDWWGSEVAARSKIAANFAAFREGGDAGKTRGNGTSTCAKSKWQFKITVRHSDFDSALNFLPRARIYPGTGMKTGKRIHDAHNLIVRRAGGTTRTDRRLAKPMT